MATAVPKAVLGYTSFPFLNIRTAVVNGVVNQAALDEVLYTGAHVPNDCSGGDFGYGILTSADDDAVIVATIHKGVKDGIA
jgi:hypothetical protein